VVRPDRLSTSDGFKLGYRVLSGLIGLLSTSDGFKHDYHLRFDSVSNVGFPSLNI
jgi:hypothetical protein